MRQNKSGAFEIYFASEEGESTTPQEQAPEVADLAGRLAWI